MNDRNAAIALIPSIGVLLLVAAGVMLSPTDLDSPRPQVPKLDLPIAGEGIPARLWEDPLAAVWAEPATQVGGDVQGGSRFSSDAALSGDLANALLNAPSSEQDVQPAPASSARPSSTKDQAAAHKGPTLVLLTTVPGTGYAESKETRLRTRYAVLTGLASMGFYPEIGQRIGAFETSIASTRPEKAVGQDSKATQTASASVVRLRVPFEWFRPEDPEGVRSRFGSVLVLWINEETLSERLLTTLEALRELLIRIPRRQLAERILPGDIESKIKDSIVFDILGPSNSTELESYVRNDPSCRDAYSGHASGHTVQASPGKGGQGPLKEPEAKSALFRIRSPWSTAVLKGLDCLDSHSDDFAFMPSIGTDRELAALLAHELRLRNVRPQVGPIVIVSEWDTVYGRKMTSTFQEVLDEEYPDEKVRIVNYGYLRGIDGRRPGKKDDTVRRTADNAEDFAGTIAPLKVPIEWPEGEAQYDYLRRLGDQLQRDCDREGQIQAIGVTGSDVYDKLLVLRALRRRFPQAVFFTTDLDVRLLHPAETASTHNLLVASHYSLLPGSDLSNSHRSESIQGDPSRTPVDETLEERLQSLSQQGRRPRFPPFRYTYQTAVALAVMASVSEQPRVDRRDLSRSRLYEVSRTGPVLLNGQRRRLPSPLGAWLSTVVLAALFLPMLLLTAMRRRRDRGEGGTRLDAICRSPAAHAAATVLLFVLPFAALSAASMYDSRSPHGEPLGFASGVSVWPSEFMLLLLSILAYLFYRKMWNAFQARLDDLQESFFEGAATPEKDPDNPNRPDALQLWTTFKKRMSSGEMARRMAIYAPLSVVAACVMLLFFPKRPIRGELVTTLDCALLATALSGTIVVIVFSLVTTCYAYVLIRSLGEGATLWPEGSQESLESCSTTVIEVREKILDERLDIAFIARLTAYHNACIYFPFVLLLLYGLAHYPIFDNWVYRSLEIGEYGLGLILAALPLIAVRAAATRSRAAAIRRLEQARIRLVGQGKDAKPIEQCLAEIRVIKTGAFTSLAQNPVLHALSLPFGGIGGLALLDFLLG